MFVSLCQYSLSRTAKKYGWSSVEFAKKAKELGVDYVDFHEVYLGSSKEAPDNIKKALSFSGLKLSALAISNNFNKPNDEEFSKQIKYVKEWILVASKISAPICRIFGGHIAESINEKQLAKAYDRVLEGLGIVVKDAEKYGVILALENHGCLPCTGEEQNMLIEQINSKNLKATIDVGNYMQGGQEGHLGTAVASKNVGYVHFKDFIKTKSSINTWGWDIEPCAIGEGDVDHLLCLRELQRVGYKGPIALEYEGIESEETALPRSIEKIRSLIEEIQLESPLFAIKDC